MDEMIQRYEVLIDHLYEAKCLLEDCVPKRFRGHALDAVVYAKKYFEDLTNCLKSMNPEIGPKGEDPDD
jgi:hypothetical protein